MVSGLQLGFFSHGTLLTTFEQLYRMSRHDGRYRMLIDKLGVPITPQQHAEIVEPSYNPLQLHAIDEKNGEGDFCLAYVI